MELPPILPDVEQELRDYLICIEKLPIHEYERNQQFWPREPDPKSLYHHDGSPLCSLLKVQRDPNTGEIMRFHETPLQGVGANSRNSLSLNRAPAPPNESVKGSVMNFPFLPANFCDPVSILPKHSDADDAELLTIPPGFSRGFKPKCNITSESDILLERSRHVINLMDLVQQEQSLLGTWQKEQIKEDVVVEVAASNTTSLPEEEQLLAELPILKISETPQMAPGLAGSEWAVLLDTSKPVTDFYERIGEMAHKYEFELDTFQKQAILQLEQHNHVFVAAHTSAGKTVVAEYAIALSQRHMTRTIYTSPIKALSNQKYRDFKKVFKDVGLITGDFQINPTAACLIMTTEILRSMLYCGSEITRDLEYVIFDEVHYINDEERGHVWEQVLILLPSHVCVVLLSATVPNTIEFADWIGHTHRKKVYVVSTAERPVPLQHYLYTGSGGSTKDNKFLILDTIGWHAEGYNKAIKSIEIKKNKLTAKNDKQGDKNIAHKQPYKKEPYMPRFNESTYAKQEKTMWCGLVDHFARNNLLPVVAFTFSRAKCDKNAENLKSLDLTTQKEKQKIYSIFERCVKTLKEPDRDIPQIQRMKYILQRGIGVHHSGILPILKEMVEILFQKELIKLLFATETFAMGVNMPTRTVVFDAIRKHDGKTQRDLLPAEYIQMAGRAGRRGMDKTGTVILLCRDDVPSSLDLQKVMLGTPNKLKSQFRVTYGMVLSLLRVESLSVEGMMSRSFREIVHQKEKVKVQEELKEVEMQLETFNNELGDYLQPLVMFYNHASAFLRLRKDHLSAIMDSNNVLKALKPGRVVLITRKSHINKLALILQLPRSLEPAYNVLVLKDKDCFADADDKPDVWYNMLGLARNNVFVPIGAADHEVLIINRLNIFEISARTIKVDTDLVYKDWDKRQLARFRADPPGQSCSLAIQELLKLSLLASNETKYNKLDYLDFRQDLKVCESKLYDYVLSLEDAKSKLFDVLPGTQISSFEEQFEAVFERKFLEDRKDELQVKLSDSSLYLYPDYKNTICLLRELKYVDSQNNVELKGRIACEMGMNELLITELVLRNILTKLEPAEVAALLSCLVCQVRPTVIDPDPEWNLSDNLKKALIELKNVHNEIIDLENFYQVAENSRFGNELNFGLVEVVYNWATAKPFAEIMTLVEKIQEGIIVRCIQQLNETICDVKDAARLIGDPELHKKMEEASSAIKRDIVFAASLYTRNEVITI